MSEGDVLGFGRREFLDRARVDAVSAERGFRILACDTDDAAVAGGMPQRNEACAVRLGGGAAGSAGAPG
jgi:hypothetical protein